MRSNPGGEFQSTQMINHQDQRGTIRELTVHDSPPQNGVAERGMRTRAERAQALLIASRLLRFLWEEAMKHATWLQNRSPASALDGKTLYEMVHNKKPHLAGIQEFGAAAYVKDLKAGKLDAHAQLGRFVGYDSESKGYRIYWPGKRSISVKCNVAFNQDDLQINDGTLSISGGVQSEGEMESEKVIQYPINHVEDPEKVDMEEDVDSQPEKEALDKGQDPNMSSTIPFTSVAETITGADDGNGGEESQQQYGWGQCPRKAKGAYKDINEGLTAAITHFEDLNEDKNTSPSIHVLRLQTIKAIIDSCSFKSPKSDEPRRVQALDLYCLTRFESESSSKGIVY